MYYSFYVKSRKNLLQSLRFHAQAWFLLTYVLFIYIYNGQSYVPLFYLCILLVSFEGVHLAYTYRIYMNYSVAKDLVLDDGVLPGALILNPNLTTTYPSHIKNLAMRNIELLKHKLDKLFHGWVALSLLVVSCLYLYLFFGLSLEFLVLLILVYLNLLYYLLFIYLSIKKQEEELIEYKNAH